MSQLPSQRMLAMFARIIYERFCCIRRSAAAIHLASESCESCVGSEPDQMIAPHQTDLIDKTDQRLHELP